MDFRLSDDQIAIRDGVRVFCEQSLTPDRWSSLETGFDRGLWAELAELDVFRLRGPENEGGLGLGMVEAVVVFEELGRRLAPAPALWTHLAAGRIEGAADGDTVVGGIELATGDHTEILVDSFEALDVLLVVRDDGVEQLPAAALRAEPAVGRFDPLAPVSLLSKLPQGEPVGDAECVRQLRREGAVLSAAQLLGMAEATLELANAYAKGREQFGRPIGGFQAIKHMLADMYCRQEVARAAVYAAGATLDTPAVGDVDRATSAAKLTCSEASMRNARTCIQIHGGMGYTWDVPAHYYLKRSWLLEHAFGTVDEHAEVLADSIAKSIADSIG